MLVLASGTSWNYAEQQKSILPHQNPVEALAMPSPLVISINGPDNVGKTTQITMLPPHYTIHVLGSLHNVEGKLADLARSGRLKNWWWTSSDEEFVRDYIQSCADIVTSLHRQVGADMSILDRGALYV